MINRHREQVDMKEGMLKALDRERIFKIQLSDDAAECMITEGCDEHFSVTMSKKELDRLIFSLSIVKHMMK